MNLDCRKLGAALMAAGPVLMQFSTAKWAWWIGLGFLISGPFLLAVKTKTKKEKP